MRTLTGIQPSGTLHLGNYFGAMLPAIEAQARGECFYFIADYHSMTSLYDPAERRKHTLGVALDWLACGLDPQRSVFWRQSDVSEVTELMWILGTLIASTLITLAWGYWRVYAAKTHATLGLNSVGHVNHSAIYMAIVFGVALSLALAWWERMGAAGRAISGLAAAALVASVIVTESRAAVGAAALYVIVLAAVFGIRRRRRADRGAQHPGLGAGRVRARRRRFGMQTAVAGALWGPEYRDLSGEAGHRAVYDRLAQGRADVVH